MELSGSCSSRPKCLSFQSPECDERLWNPSLLRESRKPQHYISPFEMGPSGMISLLADKDPLGKDLMREALLTRGTAEPLDMELFRCMFSLLEREPRREPFVLNSFQSRGREQG